MSDWKHFSRWFHEINEEKFFIKRISTLDVQDYTGHLTRVGAAPATINRRLVFLKKYVSFGCEKNLVREGTLAEVKAIKGKKRQTLAPKALAKKEVRTFLRELELRANIRNQAIVYL